MIMLMHVSLERLCSCFCCPLPQDASFNLNRFSSHPSCQNSLSQKKTPLAFLKPPREALCGGLAVWHQRTGPPVPSSPFRIKGSMSGVRRLHPAGVPGCGLRWQDPWPLLSHPQVTTVPACVMIRCKCLVVPHTTYENDDDDYSICWFKGDLPDFALWLLEF